MKKKVIIWIVIVLIIAGGAYYFYKKNSKPVGTSEAEPTGPQEPEPTPEEVLDRTSQIKLFSDALTAKGHPDLKRIFLTRPFDQIVMMLTPVSDEDLKTLTALTNKGFESLTPDEDIQQTEILKKAGIKS